MARGVVVVYFSRFGKPLQWHHKVVLDLVAKAIAKIKGYEFGGHYDPEYHYSGPLFFVPDDTLLLDEAARLGIRSSNDLYGGVVPHLFAKTKAITHGLIDRHAERPLGWSTAFAERVREIVLPGYTVFSNRDAQMATGRMLACGPIRVKKPLSASGKDQTVVTTLNELDAELEKVGADEMATYGLVLEENLRQVRTLSVGEVAVGGLRMSYHGTQRTVRDNEGRPVYGGSDLVCVRGGWESLDALPMSPEVRAAVVAARRYDAATEELPGFTGSRRNYDVAQGIGADGSATIGGARAFVAHWWRKQRRARRICSVRAGPILKGRRRISCRGIRHGPPSSRRCDRRFSGRRSRVGPPAPIHHREATRSAVASKNLRPTRGRLAGLGAARDPVRRRQPCHTIPIANGCFTPKSSGAGPDRLFRDR
jgi:hypothetical protein